MAAVQLLLALLKAGIEIAGATVNDDNQIDLYSKVKEGAVPGLCILQFTGETKLEEPHDLVGGVGISCFSGNTIDYYMIYQFENMGTDGENKISDPHIGDFTISFSGSGPQVQVPLEGNAVLDSSWYATVSGTDTFSTVGLQDLALNPILMDNCAGDSVDVIIGDYEFSSDSNVADQQIIYSIVVPAKDATGQCPS
ncbi:hypothetical protein PFICI_12287 [Pestalotiopsis fici W106-1]|uniref:Secreted protein n=1 Tax=Pestalotiopsis fici (strain W106-1 / CGMCC3.15140) TaxID=1229662 RepID=W3WNA9_PESFW|nr:uncharacterized protein PFICI_12287 [Pestalotiopsis fici W106-1]ETS75343.1 hypothetical protein PFICI_12287 [Pestalotiopsis fici W106-1]